MRRIAVWCGIVVLVAAPLFLYTRRLVTVEFDQRYGELMGQPAFNVYVDGRRATWVSEPSCARIAPVRGGVGQYTCRGSLLIPRRGRHTISVSATSGNSETAKASATTP